MKHSPLFIRHSALCIAALAAIAASAAEPFVIARRGADACCGIVIPTNSGECVRYAAEELRKYTKRMTGVELPVIDAGSLVSPPPRAVYLGVDNSTCSTRSTRLKDLDAFKLCVSNGNLRIVGGGPSGVLYGVYELLERFGECGWFAPWCEKVPEREAFEVPGDLDFADAPAFDQRSASWLHTKERYTKGGNAFAAKMRFKHTDGTPGGKFGGPGVRYARGLSWDNGIKHFVRPETHFEEHPEWFCEIGGVRRGVWPWQVCYTAPGLAEFVAERVKEVLRTCPCADAISIAQMDCANNCQCAACRAAAKEAGATSGPSILFANAVAEEVEKEFPDALIETLAYQYTRKPPKKTRLRHNVIPCLCTIECDFAQPIDVSPYKQNISFRDDIRGWAKQTDLLYVWDYTTDFRNYTMPFPNVYALQGNVKFFRDNGVKCLFEQGAYQGRHGDFAELKSWLLAKWMWNPDLPMEPLLDDFFAGYYGKAAPFVRDYFEAIHKMQRFASSFPNKPLRIFDSVANSVLPDEFLDFAAGCWEQALDAVKDDPVTSYNVRMAAFSFDYLRLERLRRKTDKVLILAQKSIAADELAKAKGLAKSLLDRMAEAKDIRLAESGSRHEQLQKEWRELVARSPVAAQPMTSGEVEERHISIARKGTWGDYADDPKAADGKALKLFNSHFEWCSTFPMHRVEFEPGATYKVRVRVRVDKLRDGGEAFWAGVYDPVAKVGRGGIQPRTEKTSADYAWYDVCTWVPNEHEYFWIGPGRFGKDGKSSIKAVWIDKLEISRVTP
jgi:hypothetical protein